jgi:fluoroacetyl-CoA thioesterase
LPLRSSATLAGHLGLSYGTGVRLEPGLGGKASLVVSDSDTAREMGSGSVPVLATPRLIALCEEASCRALDGVFDESKTSVGVRVQFDHLAPVRPGTEVTAEAVLERVEGRRLTFTVSASDAAGLVGAGRVTRVVVLVDSFLEKAR